MTRNSDSSLKSDEAMAAALSLQRPKRQRNPTTYYTDDKPNTFTTKRYRGQYVYGPSAPNPSYMARDEGASYSASSDSSTSSSPDTSSEKKKMANGVNGKKKPQSRRGSASSNGSSSSITGTRRGPGRPPASASASASLSPPKKRGPGRPPKRAKSLENPALLLLTKVPPKTAVSSINPNSTAKAKSSSRAENKTSITTSKRQSTSPYRNSKRNLNEAGVQEEEEDIDDVEDDDEERNARRKRGRPPKTRVQDEDDNKSRTPSSSVSSTSSRKRTSMTSNPPSHGHATRGGGAANLIRPVEKPSPVSSRRSTISSRGKKGATRNDSNLDNGTDDDGDNDDFEVESTARSTRMNNNKKTTRGLLSSPPAQKWRSSLSSSTTTSHLADASMSPGRKLLSSSKVKSAKSSSSSSGRISSPSDILNDVDGTFLAHSVTVAPILPPVSIESGSNKNQSIASNDIVMDDNANSDVGVDEALLRSRFPGAFETGVPPSCSKSSSFANNKNQTSSSSNQTSSSSSSSENVMDALPSWTPLYNPPIFFEEDYDAESGLLDLKSTLPVVSRRITAVAVRQPQRDYLAVGDSIGFVTVYSLMPGSSTPSVGPRPIARLESVACQQRGRVEQERIRSDILRRRKGRNGNSSDVNNLFYSIDSSTNALVSGSAASVQRDALGPTAAAAVANEANTPTAGGAQQLRSILMNTTDTDVHALAMISNRVVLATQIELECMDVPSGTSLWVCPLSTNRIVTSVDMHLSTYDVLVSCSKSNDSPNDAVSTAPDESSVIASPVSPLMLLQHAKDNVEICDANSPMLVRSPSCTAIWDCGNANRLIFLALSSNRQELDLVLVSGGSIDTWKVACKTKIPTKAPTHSTTSTTKLSQSPCGQYTLVACTRGIRLYQTETLQLIHVYGDQLALHGQSVNWKDCWLAGSYFHEGADDFRRARLPGGTKSSVWLECNDFVKAEHGNRRPTRNSVASSMDGALEKNQPATASTLPPYVIGVPHTKKNGPKELCEKLHVWKVEQAGVVPSMSIPLPSKAEGAIGLVGSCGQSASDDRLVLVTDDGQGHLLLPRIESSFAGTMYPPGYQIVTDNIEYIENEDALDEVPDVETTAADVSDNEEGEDVSMLAAENDDMDEELREAMRQSLLELKRQKLAKDADEQDGFVDVLSTMEGKDGTTFVPCRPEPYLRQAMNSQNDEDDKDDDESTLYKTTKEERVEGTTSVDQKVVTSAVFVSNVLGIMPNKEKPQETVEEDCLSFTTTKVVMAVNPVVQARPGRGRKGRAGNLDTLIKASINPYLQSLMISKQSVPSNGNGSRSGIPKSSNQTDCPKLDTIAEDARMSDHDKDEKCLNNNDTASSNKAPHGYEETSTPQTSTNDEAEVALGLLGLTPCISPRPSDESSKATPSGPDNVSHRNVHAYLNASSLSNFANSIESSVLTAINTPLNGDTIAPPESVATSSDRGSIDGDLETTPGYGGKRKHKACMFCLACRGRQVVHSCGNRSLPIDYDEVAKVERERKLKEEEDKKKARAEKRRLADQRRREAKKQKQRELEQQRIRDAQKERMEIERQQRLREDFASQDLNRLRRDQIVASYASHLSHIRDADHTHHQQLGASTTASANSSAGPLTAKPVVEQHHVPAPPSPAPAPVAQPQGGMVFGRPTSAGEAAAAARHRTPGYTLYDGNGTQENTHTTGSHGGVAHPSTAQSNAMAAATASSSSAAAAAALPRSPPQSATLASADALVALATFAGASQALATSPSPAPTKSVVDGALTSYPYSIPRTGDNGGRTWDGTHTASASTTQHLPHGFSSTVPATAPASVSAPQSQYAATAEVKRSIPSYAAIHGEGNGNPTATPSQSFTAAQSVTTDSLNSFTTTGGHTTVETYVWPARQDAANDAALAMTALGSMLMGNQPTNGARTGNPSEQSQNQ
eukprot:CAMPEP_0113467648 /NCGR_PEP_ID=MMETSP0014_2-20120614/14928_1 /TAXON_ID=2857 /ORGANISM="Nitzschia sp." /LENGTH=1921 /DNA_ID=CAMNT_0000359973 /DNA_START=128 /DNA_END=5893 /DNA_ORIENTATION=- /assembly_acc=CAM_ASM_000159